jgi:LysR family transcriptional regulator of gallate degradation
MRFNLRHLRVFLAVVDTRSVTKAAEICHISQPAVTQALAKIEAIVGESLFQRTPHGLFANKTCETLAIRVRRAFAYLDPALVEIAPRLKLTATVTQLQSLIAVRELENYTLAARNLGVAQPTVHRAVSQLEREAGRPLFERTSYGMLATRGAQMLAQAARLAFAELLQADADLADSRAEEAGCIAVGAMPLSRSHILPTAIAHFRRTRQKQPIQVFEGVYAELLSGLRRGDIDFLIGALRDPAPIGDVEQFALFFDTVIIVAGCEHPITQLKKVELADLAAYPWIVAQQGTPIRMHFDAMFEASGREPLSIVESGSLILMRELLDQSHHLGFISGGQAKAEVSRGLMRAIPFDLSYTSRPIGITQRTGWMPTAAQSLFLDLLKSLAESETSSE